MATSQPRAQIVVENLKKDYLGGKVEALRGVNFSVNEGEFIVILGPSGCGKSTLLGLLAALDAPSSGTVSVYGHNINNLNPKGAALYRRHEVGMVFQQFNLVGTLNARQNIALPLILAGVKSSIANKRAQVILEIMGLGDRGTHRPVQLSGGEQQRIAIGRALALNPAILLVDEPTGNLDETNSAEIMKALQEINSWGRTVILVTHNQDYASFADRVLEMKDGTIRGQKINRNGKKSPAGAVLEKIKNFIPEKIDGVVSRLNIMKLAWAHLRNNKLRTFFAVFGVALGIGTIIGLISLGIGLQRITSDQIASFNALVSIEIAKNDTSTYAFDDALVNELEGINNVEFVSPSIVMAGNAEVNGVSTAVVATGLNEQALGFEGVNLENGKFDDIVISAATAKNFGSSNAADLIGKSVSIQIIGDTGDNPTVDDLQNALQGKAVTGTITGVSKDDLISAVYMPLEKMQAAVGDQEYTSIKVKAKSRKDVAAIRGEVEKLGLSTKSVTDLIQRIDRIFLVVQIVLGVIGSVALIVALLGIVNIMTISLIERTHEVGIMKAIGASNTEIGRLFASEATTLGVMGGILGVTIALLVGIGLNSLLTALMRLSGEDQGVILFYSPWTLLVGMLLIAYVVARLAGWYPSRRAAKLSAMEALRNE